MKYVKAMFAGILMAIACSWFYVAGHEDTVARAEADFLRAQAAESDQRMRLDAAAALRREHELKSRDEAPHRRIATGLPVDTIRNPSPHTTQALPGGLRPADTPHSAHLR